MAKKCTGMYNARVELLGCSLEAIVLCSSQLKVPKAHLLLFSLLYNRAITCVVHLELQSRKILTPREFTPKEEANKGPLQVRK